MVIQYSAHLTQCRSGPTALLTVVATPAACCPPAGIFVAQLINYGTQHIDPWGWRLSLALAGVPGVMLFVGALLLPDTPNR